MNLLSIGKLEIVFWIKNFFRIHETTTLLLMKKVWHSQNVWLLVFENFFKTTPISNLDLGNLLRFEKKKNWNYWLWLDVSLICLLDIWGQWDVSPDWFPLWSCHLQWPHYWSQVSFGIVQEATQQVSLILSFLFNYISNKAQKSHGIIDVCLSLEKILSNAVTSQARLYSFQNSK